MHCPWTKTAASVLCVGMTTVTALPCAVLCRSEGSGDISKDLSKAKALGNALLLCLVVPWAICLIVYTGMLPTAACCWVPAP